MKQRFVLFALAGLLVIALPLVALFPAAAQTATPVPTVNINLTGVPSATPIVIAPPATQTPFPTLPSGFIPAFPTPTECAQPLPLFPGAIIALTPGVNLRSQPSTSGAAVNYYTEETVLVVLDGPVCASGYNWWYVAGVGQPGWAIEGRPGRYFMELLPEPQSVCLPPADLTAGEPAVMLTGVRVHLQPDVTSLVTTVALYDTTVAILSGPVCVNGMNWWYVRVPYGVSDQNQPTDVTVDGWLGEGYPPDDPWIAATGPSASATAQWCHRPLRLERGDRAATIYRDGVPRSLRSEPSQYAPVVQSMLAGIAFDITGDSVCNQGFNWWPVRLVVDGQTGWLAEGLPGNYWFDIIYERSG